MEQNERRTEIVTLNVTPEMKTWLAQQQAKRIVEGFPHGRRSMAAIAIELIEEAMKKEPVAA